MEALKLHIVFLTKTKIIIVLSLSGWQGQKKTDLFVIYIYISMAIARDVA